MRILLAVLAVGGGDRPDFLFQVDLRPTRPAKLVRPGRGEDTEQRSQIANFGRGQSVRGKALQLGQGWGFKMLNRLNFRAGRQLELQIAFPCRRIRCSAQAFADRVAENRLHASAHAGGCLGLCFPDRAQRLQHVLRRDLVYRHLAKDGKGVLLDCCRPLPSVLGVFPARDCRLFFDCHLCDFGKGEDFLLRRGLFFGLVKQQARIAAYSDFRLQLRGFGLGSSQGNAEVRSKPDLDA